MVQNQKLLQRICMLISQTFAVQLDAVIEKVKMVGIESTIEELESQEKNIRY
jgi:hypothetical protein